MAKQTIIVMSDSHGDSLIVEEIRNRYLGKVDAIFHDGDSELRQIHHFGKESRSSEETWIFIQIIQNAW